LSGKNKETKGKTYRSRGGGLLDLGGLDSGLGGSDGGDLGLDLLDGGGCSSDFRGRHYGSWKRRDKGGKERGRRWGRGTYNPKILSGRERKMESRSP
jgi:hypothetical protein